jgi:hypothetical protein
MPIEYNDRDSFILSQFSSVIVMPVAKPSICVLTAVDAAVLQMSELLTTTLGALAVGGVLLVTTVLDTVLVSAPFALVTALTTRINVKTMNSILTI